jgi:AcrR family transcriptional regulator
LEKHVARREADVTRQRILSTAQGLYAQKGYAGTSMADLANELGLSKAALYYHFSSKEKLLAALLAGPLDNYEELAEKAAADAIDATGLLRALIDMTADAEVVLTMLRNDPSIGSAMKRTYNLLQQPTDKIMRGLTGPDPRGADLVRAHAAYAVAKQATFALMTERDAPLTVQDRQELLAAAIRALYPDGQGPA